MTEAPEQRLDRRTHGHKKCARCGNKSFSVGKKCCVKCGFGRTSKRNDKKKKFNTRIKKKKK